MHTCRLFSDCFLSVDKFPNKKYNRNGGIFFANEVVLLAKYLIVNADDFGMCGAANDAVIELLETGGMQSATVMMPCPAAEDAARFAAAHPEYAIGVHLTLTSEWNTYRWGSLTGGKTLEDADGFLWKTSKLVEQNATNEDIERELRAQVDLAYQLGMRPSHLDNHMGSTYGHKTGRFGLLKLALRVCGDYGLPYRMFTETDKRLCPAGVPYPIFRLLKYPSRRWSRRYGVILPDYMLFPDWTDDLKQSYDHYRECILRLWTDIPDDGITETFIHPALDTPELREIAGSWRYRNWEYQLMRDPETHKYLADHGVKMINYRDLVQMKTGTR